MVMANATPAPAVRKSPVQEAVTIVQNIVLGGTNGAAYEVAIKRLHELMAQHAFASMRSEYEQALREVDADYVLTIEEVTSDENGHTPMAAAYWEATSVFFRRVFQACAAAT